MKNKFTKIKKAPVIILLVILIAGFICVFGNVLLSLQIDHLSKLHQEIMTVHMENREFMSSMKSLLYAHQADLVNHALSENKEEQEYYEQQLEVLSDKITSLIVDFSYITKGGEREKLYHKIFSNYASYRSNANTLLKFSSNSDKHLTIYYNDNVLKPFLSEIDSSLEELDQMTIQQITDAEEKMARETKYSYILRGFVIILILAIMAICLVTCFSIVSALNAYKNDLEQELIQKNKDLQARNEKMIELQNGIIYGMANLIESRDGETGEHTKRTSVYVGMIARQARKMGFYNDILTDEYIERLTKVAPLHDVGKIMVPDYILLKPGRFTDEEFEIMQDHAPKGGEIIKNIFGNIEDKEYVDMASDVATYHHEKWNGNGYASGFAGEEIPLSARIMAIADVFDALVSRRRYKDPYDLQQAFEIIRESAGSHFDPKLTEAFLALTDQIKVYLGEA